MDFSFLRTRCRALSTDFSEICRDSAMVFRSQPPRWEKRTFRSKGESTLFTSPKTAAKLSFSMKIFSGVNPSELSPISSKEMLLFKMPAFLLEFFSTAFSIRLRMQTDAYGQQTPNRMSEPHPRSRWNLPGSNHRDPAHCETDTHNG